MPMTIQIQRPESLRNHHGYPPDTVPALASFLDELAEQGVQYCHWKSNLRLRDGLAGMTDLDLLLDPDQASRLRGIAARHRLKPLVPPPDGAHPGMEHFLGLDQESGRLFHLHVHYQLVLGEAYVKNYRFPIEAEFLHSTRLLHGVPVPRAELELSILAVRALLKYRSRDVVKDLLGIRSAGLPKEIRAEIGWLLDQTTVEEVRTALRKIGGAVPPDLVSDFLEIATRAPRSGYGLLRLRGRLRRAVSGFQRQSRLRATIEYHGRAWRRRRRLRRRLLGPRMTPAGGGLTVAVVGADGSGKSTITDAVARWLSWKLEVRAYYMGSKAPSRRSRWLYISFRALRRGHRAVSQNLSSSSKVVHAIATARDVMLALHCLAIGRDRARRYRGGRRAARAGRVVIYDRFPIESLSSRRGHRLLDGPQISTVLGESGGGLTRALATAEERMYRRFELPNYFVVLQVTPEVSADRKPDHRPDVLVAKGRAVAEMATLAETSGLPVKVIRIDANRPLDAVLVDVKGRLWDVL
jgi:thymidylate kinase